MTDRPAAPTFINALLEWADTWRPPNHSVTTHRGVIGDPASAWVQAMGPITSGQVTIWDTGECEMEVYEGATLLPRWIEHFDLATTPDLADALRRFASALDGHSGALDKIDTSR